MGVLRTLKSAGWPLLASGIYHLGLAAPLGHLASRFELIQEEERLPRLVRSRCRKLQILIYHRVLPVQDEFLPATSLDVFEGQARYLARHCRVLSLQAAVNELLEDSLVDDTVVITFDDGYRDNLTHALPILEKYGLPATIFLVTDCIGTGRVLWHDQIFRGFSITQKKEISGLNDLIDLSWSTPKEKYAARDEVLHRLKNLREDERADSIGRILQRLEVDQVDSRPGLMLNWTDILEMQRKGVSFGSHTASHPILVNAPIEQVRWELATSKAVLEERLGEEIRAFAYPSGRRRDFDDRTISCLREVGYSVAVTTIAGNNSHRSGRPDLDPLTLHRDTPWEDVPARFATRLALAKLAT
jgi:peptidoglycan/xylan/chitin deacetylase (PgdA/CDA1 family)